MKRFYYMQFRNNCISFSQRIYLNSLLLSFAFNNGLQEEIHEIVKTCPSERQTLLFSATMGTKLTIPSNCVSNVLWEYTCLQKTKRVKTDPRGRSYESLGPRVRPCPRFQWRCEPWSNVTCPTDTVLYQKSRCLFRFTKDDAHRFYDCIRLMWYQKCWALYGHLAQVQRLEALEQFREGSVDVRLATDLSARGLDISSVEAVINFEMPAQWDTYVHRIDRTARAGGGARKGVHAHWWG